MKKKKIKGLIIMAVAIAMIATTAISFAYWSSGASAPSEDHSLTITIGAGDEIDTKLTFADSQTAGALIPKDITPKAGEVTSITFTVTVNWEPDGVSSISDDLSDFTGTLTVSKKSIIVDDADDTDLTTAKGKGGTDDLFEFAYTVAGASGATGTIRGNDSVTVVITVQMNQPIDKEQYDLVANQEIEFTFTFAVSGTTFNPAP